jgi:uncharacterized repeat protein (TIGR03803 family)
MLAVAFSVLLSFGQARAAHFTTLYRFTDGTDGESPTGLVEGNGGVLYGVTGQGGDPSCHLHCSDFGTLYSFSQTTGLKTLIYFTGPNGSFPGYALLLSGTTLYGNAGGGANNDGVTFSVHTDGTGFTLLHQFSGTDGMAPAGTPRLGAAGVLYGITTEGGPNGDGVLFSIAPNGTYTILHAFTGGADGGNPTSLLISSTGELFGSTFQGGADSTCLPPSGCGVVFNYTPATGAFATEYTFTTTQSDEPLLGSIGPGPTVYGTASGAIYIGEPDNTIFSIGPSGFKTVITLTGVNAGAEYPGPTLAPDGSLLLTVGPSPLAAEGELLDIKGGTIAGSVGFTGNAMGGFPSGQPIVTPNGTVFGTTAAGGICYGCGTIYEVTQ